MEKKGTFDHLVGGLKQEEKQTLLEKIRTRSSLSPDPLISEKNAVVRHTTGNDYDRLPFLTRLWYWFLGLCTGKSAPESYLSNLVKLEGRVLNERYPGIYDASANSLKGGFRRELQSLKDAARFFYTVLDAGFRRDKGAFFGYIGSVVIPAVHKELVENSDPDIISAEHPDMIDARLRGISLEIIEKRISSISDDDRSLMYEASRMIFLLNALASFLYDRLLLAFGSGGETEASCPVTVVHQQITELSQILNALKKVPEPSIISALFLFSTTTEREGTSSGQDEALQKFLKRAEKSIAVIRNFNKQVPLITIIRCATRDFEWEPRELSGGEDWAPVYKSYWVSVVEKKFHTWIRERMNASLLQEFDRFFSGEEMFPLEYARNDDNDEGIPVDNVLMLSFLLTFHKKKFMPEINVVIRPILVDGDFYKKENKQEFMEAYNVIIKLDDVIKGFDAGLASSGEYGKMWTAAENDMQSLPLRKRKMQAISDEVNRNAYKIVDDTNKSLVSMDNVLSGIVNRDENSRYDTLTNLANIAGRGTSYTDALHQSIRDIRTAHNIVEDILEAAHVINGKE